MASLEKRRRRFGPATLAGTQGVRAGSLYLILALGVSGASTLLFQIIARRSLGPDRWGSVAILWSCTFLASQVLWVSTTQTLARHISEREARGEGWLAVVHAVRRLGLFLLGGFVVLVLLLSPLFSSRLFGGERWLTAALVVAVAGYAFNYFRRGLLTGHRQFARLSVLLITESLVRLLLTAILIGLGAGILGPAIAIAAAPILGALVVRPSPSAPSGADGAPFDLGHAMGFALPVLVCMSCAQAIANGGPIVIGGLGGPDGHVRAGLMLNALTLTRMPQFVLSPAVNNLLPHLSRIAAIDDRRAFDRFAGTAFGLIALAGAGLVGGTWLLGELAMRLTFGADAAMDRVLLTVLALLAALYLLNELLNQILFARGLAALAAAGWVLGLLATAVGILVLKMELLARVSYALAIGAMVTSVALASAHLLTSRTRRPTTPTVPDSTTP